MAFEKAIETCIKENTAFLLISGDLFNTSLPSIDLIKRTAAILKKLKNKSISCYIIPGSHDFSPSGKTMIDVLEKAGLVENVMKVYETNGKLKLSFTVDKTNSKITGIFGKKSGLETSYYNKLERDNLEAEKGFKIFMFHTLLTELKPKDMEVIETEPLSLLPKGFDYYAGGHPHFVYSKNHKGYGLITYPGPIFPNNFKELEGLKHGNMFIVTDKLEVKHIPLKIKDVVNIYLNVNGKSAVQAEEMLIKDISKYDVKDKIITIRIEGILSSGKATDIKFTEIFSKLDAYYILKNTNKLSSKEFEELKIDGGNAEEIEAKIIKEHLGQIKISNEERLTHDLVNAFNLEKNEGETNYVFEERLIKGINKILDIEDDN